MKIALVFEARIRREAGEGPLGGEFVAEVEGYLAGLRVRGDLSSLEHGELRGLMRELAGPGGLAALGAPSLAEHEAAANAAGDDDD